jgi:hypothetical protein
MGIRTFRSKIWLGFYRRLYGRTMIIISIPLGNSQNENSKKRNYLRSQLGLLQYSFISEGPTHPSMSRSFAPDESSPPSTEQVRERDRVPCPQVTEQADHSVQQLQTPLHGWRLQARSINVGPSQSDDLR